MASWKNKTIAELSQWAADPQKVARFEAVALLSQRTAFVKNLLGLNEQDILVCKQIQAVCARHGVPCNMARGNGFDGVRRKSLYVNERYVASFLMSTLLATSHGGIEDSESGLASDNLVDRLIYTYRRYLAQTYTQAGQVSLNFENFCTVYEGYTLGEVNLTECQNCGASYIHRRQVPSQCPLCVVHKHAGIPGRARVERDAEDDECRSYRRPAAPRRSTTRPAQHG
jgi:hypothetical protein